MSAKEAIESLRSTMATDARDWSLDKRDAWLYGIILGWSFAIEEVQELHGWKAADVARMKAYHVALRKIAP